MKQNLLKSVLLLCGLIVGGVAWADEVTYDFTKIDGFDKWASGYTEHVVEYSEATITFKSANRQTSTITNQPVTKGQPVSLVMTGTRTISAVSFNCTQWGTKAQTITLHYSTDGGKNYTNTDVTSTTFAISSSNLPSGTNAVQITFSSTSNQVGIASATITYEDGSSKSDPKLSFSSETAEATFGQDFTPPTLNTAKGFNGTVEYSSSVETVAQVMDTETGELRIVGGGTTVITATFAGDDNFKSGSASYTLTVTDNRVATTITQENITLDVADVATLTQLTPVVKDANDKVVAYTNDPNGEGLPEVYFELVGEDTDGIIGSFDSHGNIILNSVVGTVTIKAVYNQFQINPNYRPSECTFTITVESTLNGIAEFCKLESGNTGKVRLTDAVVLYVNGKDMYVRDATGAIDFYNTSLTYKAGDVLNGTITAKYTLYNGLPELTTPISDNTIVATAGDAPVPAEITTADASINTCNLVKLTDVVVTSDNGKYYVGDVQVFDKFKLNYTLDAGRAYDIVGILIPYNTTYEICPTEAPVAGELVIDEKVTLPFAWNGGVKDDLTAIEGVTAVGLGTDYAASNAPYRVKLDTNGDYIQVKTDCKPVIASLDVKMLGGATTSYITVQESADGKQFTDVEVLTIAGESSSILYLQTSKAFAEDTRFVRFTFTKGSNVGLGGIAIEKDLDEAVVEEEGYATYIAKHNVSFPEGVEAYIGVINKEFFTTTQVTAVPKGTPVILKNTGNFTLLPASAEDLSDVTANDLVPAFEEVDADGTQYVLAKPEGQKVGFYQAESGKIAAGKAYLQSNAAVKAFYFEGEETTAITNVNGNGNGNNGGIYNMAGQRISKLQKGINIVNGKKVLF